MKVDRWSRDEVAVCARVYRRRGADLAQIALRAGGWTRSVAAIHDKMRKAGVCYEGSGNAKTLD